MSKHITICLTMFNKQKQTSSPFISGNDSKQGDPRQWGFASFKGSWLGHVLVGVWSRDLVFCCVQSARSSQRKFGVVDGTLSRRKLAS